MRQVSCVLLWLVIILTFGNAQSGPDARVHGEVWSRPFIEVKNQFGRAMMPGCEVIFRSKGFEKKLTSDKEGRYSGDLPAGMYSVSAACPKTLQGWEYYAARRADLQVKPGSNPMINFMVIIKYIKKMSTVAISQPEYGRIDLKNEYLEVKSARDPSRKILVRYFGRLKSQEVAEYHGRRDYRQDEPVAVSFDVLSIYADTVSIDKTQMHIRAAGHVIIEDGTNLFEANEATVEFDAIDPVSTVKIIS